MSTHGLLDLILNTQQQSTILKLLTQIEFDSQLEAVQLSCSTICQTHDCRQNTSVLSELLTLSAM